MKTKFFPLLLALLLSLTACGDPLSTPGLYDPPLEPLNEQTTTNENTTTSDWYTVYFTDPSSPNAETITGGPDAYLAAAIEQAQATVDVAIYDLNLWSIRNALINAHNRGVRVRVVTDSDNLDRDVMVEVINAGIEVLGDRREALMHNKFVIIDGYEVWGGSMNFTVNGAYKNNNNLIRIRSTRLAENYTVEFEEMFVSDMFGPTSPENTVYPAITVEGTDLEVWFSPEDGTQARIVDLINNAQQSIFFMAFSFTADPISEALQAAHTRGIDIAGVFETGQASGQGGEFFTLSDFGLDVELDGNPRNMHHKVFIIDGSIVITGSYNFSASAEDRNDENTLIIYSVEIANLYLTEFDRVFEITQ